MRGPEIFVRSLAKLAIPDKHGNRWQYHSRSDQHSKIGCWSLLFDLIHNCPQLLDHIRSGKIGFGINHEMRDFKQNRKKNLDLVLCRPGTGEVDPITFLDLAEKYSVSLTSEERADLKKLPELRRVPVGSVHVALEAKACMTAHIKALPRLYDEINSSHLTIHGASDFCIAAALCVVNNSESFLSPDRNKFKLTPATKIRTKHTQPKDTLRAIAKLTEIPRRTQLNTDGFDAMGIVVIDFENDRGDVKLVSGAPAPDSGDIYHYDQMIFRLSSQYAAKFGNV